MNSSEFVSGLAKISDKYSFFESHGDCEDSLRAQDTNGKAVLIKTKNEQEIRKYLTSRYSAVSVSVLLYTVIFEHSKQ